MFGLAIYESGHTPVVQVKSQRRGEVVVELRIMSGRASIKCRKCSRWHHITVGTQRVNLD